ncbi:MULTISPECIES: choice-of-anchor M domain-containing protein [Gardnerella]|uniref:Putative surface-anchored protein n=1 Tax=Gardnerella greenwoodii 00703Dmash TaxID=698960 RepID=I4MC02_9BIFI|nr:choice-of-anchor M domain-containing protein [Gardnerella greenwoodii]EIK86742.1 putative surface-anchored protein [Gardnerella greenwoodii 00703Dmash]
MTHAVKSMFKRALASASVFVLAFAVLVSGFGAAVPALASERHTTYAYDASKKDVLSNGHMDIFYPFMLNDKLIMGFEANSMLYKPENITMKVGKSSYSTKPFDNYKNKLPFDASKGYWLLDESGNKQDKELFPGWDTSVARYAVGAENPDGATADIVVQKVIAPKGGKVLVWETDKNKQGESRAKSFEYQDKDDVEGEEGSRFEFPGVIHQPQVIHQHTNWVFTQPGTYKLEVYAVIKNKKTQKTITTNTAEYTFEIAASNNHTVPLGSTIKERGKAEIPVLDANTKDEDPSDNPECKDGQLCILGIRNKGLHPHYHSYEIGGDLNLYTYMDGLKEKIASGEIKRPTYRWCITRADEQEGTEGTCFMGERLILPPEPAMNNMQVSVIVTAFEGTFDYEKQRATGKIVVEDHGADGRPVVAIKGKNKVNVGETVHLNAKLYSPRVPVVNGGAGDPEEPATSIVKKYRWMIKKDGEKNFTNIPMAEGKSLDLVVDESMQDAVIRASLVLDDGTLYRNAGYDDFCDWTVNIKNLNKNNPGKAEKSKDKNKHKNQKNSKKRKNKKIKRNKNKKRKSGENSEADGQSEDGKPEDGKPAGSKNNSKAEHAGDNAGENENASSEDNIDKVIDASSQNQTDANNNSKTSGAEQNNLQNAGSTPLAKKTQSKGGFANSGGGFTKSASRTLGGLRHSRSSSKHAKKLKKVKLLRKKSKKSTKNASYESEESNDEYSENLTEGEESQEEKDYKTKWVAAAIGAASVSLCTITGVGAFLLRSRLKML